MEAWRYQEQYDLEDCHWWFRGRRRVIWALLRRTGVAPAPRILDAGCGTGRNLVEFGALGTAQGVDLSEEAVEFCSQRGLRDVRMGPLEELPFEDARFDLILAIDVIEHLEDDRRALAELRRVAAQGARLIVTVPAYQWLWSRHDESFHHRRRYTAGRIRERVLAAGWSPAVCTYFFATLLPPIAFMRLLGGLRRDGGGRSDFQRASAAVNRGLELPVRAEARLIERGVPLPTGASIGLACVAR